MTDPKAEQNLALKVMRLTRPSFAQVSATTRLGTRGRRTGSESVESMLEPDHHHSATLSSTLVLPQSFGSIYLGETFTCYVSLHNDSTDRCDHIQMSCHLQTVTQRVPLLQSAGQEGGDSTGLTKLESGESIDHVLSHEVKELGTHILVCEVNHGVNNNSFRKYFKFQVMKPLDVKTKFYNGDSDEVVLEAQVQNVTGGSLCLEKVSLEPSPAFRVTSSLNHIDDDNNRLVFGKVNHLQSQDSRQYLFSLAPRNELSCKQLKGATSIGKLDIVWRTNFGERGRLQTSQLQRMVPNHGDVRLNVESVPGVVLLGAAFQVSCILFNNSERTLDLELALENVNGPRMLWSGGCSSRKLGLVEPSGSVKIVLEAVARDTSLQPLSGIKITDSLLMRSYQFDNICHVYVCKDENFVS